MLALLLQQGTNVDAASLFHFAAGFLLILSLYSGALLFTYWISKGE